MDSSRWNRIAPKGVLALLVLSFLAKSISAGTPAEDQHLAVQLYQANDWPAAAEALEKFASDHADHPWKIDSQFFRAEALSAARQFEQAAVAYGGYLRDVDADAPNDERIHERIRDCSIDKTLKEHVHTLRWLSTN